MFKNILVPFDGSEHAKNAYEMAKDLAMEDPEAKVYVLNIVSAASIDPNDTNTDVATIGGVPMQFVDYDVYKNIVEKAFEKAREDIKTALGAELDELGERVVVDAVADSSPVNGITEYADNHDCDLIVMGRRGLGALRGMLGSVSYGVLRSTDVPVMTVK
jgi:nucleotide-binding universal stress UspA family protein